MLKKMVLIKKIEYDFKRFQNLYFCYCFKDNRSIMSYFFLDLIIVRKDVF